MKRAAIGVDVGGTNIDFGVVSDQGELLKVWSEPTPLTSQGQDIPPRIITSLNEHIFQTNLIREVEIIGIGLCAPGVVEEEKGTIGGAYNLGWKNSVAVRRPLEEAYSLPVTLGNDALLAAYGEQWVGKGQGVPNMVLVTLGTGVGGGIVINSELVKGAGGSAGEIGHIFVQEEGYLCTCGNYGCLETVASGRGIVRLAQDQYRTYSKESMLAAKLEEGLPIDAGAIFAYAEAGDVFASEIVRQFSGYLGQGLSHIGNILNPDKILLGGGMSQAGERLVAETSRSFETHVYPNVRQTTKIELASLTNRAGVIGAGRYLFHELKLL